MKHHMKHLNKLAAVSLLLAGCMSAAAINVTFHVDCPDAVSMSSNGTVTTLAAEGVTADVTRDIICDVADLDATLSCFAGTQINIAKADKSIDVKVNGEALTVLEGGENYQFVVTAPETNVEITARGTEGIDGITTDSEVAVPVYNLQGVKVSETLEGLPAGIYITSGRKVVVK